jgi:hypothetical protein
MRFAAVALIILAMAPAALAEVQQDPKPKADPPAVRGPLAEPDTYQGRTTKVCLSGPPGEEPKEVPCPPQPPKDKPPNYGKPTLYPAIPN